MSELLTQPLLLMGEAPGDTMSPELAALLALPHVGGGGLPGRAGFSGAAGEDRGDGGGHAATVFADALTALLLADGDGAGPVGVADGTAESLSRGNRGAPTVVARSGGSRTVVQSEVAGGGQTASGGDEVRVPATGLMPEPTLLGDAAHSETSVGAANVSGGDVWTSGGADDARATVRDVLIDEPPHAVTEAKPVPAGDRGMPAVRVGAPWVGSSEPFGAVPVSDRLVDGAADFSSPVEGGRPSAGLASELNGLAGRDAAASARATRMVSQSEFARQPVSADIDAEFLLRQTLGREIVPDTEPVIPVIRGLARPSVRQSVQPEPMAMRSHGDGWNPQSETAGNRTASLSRAEISLPEDARVSVRTGGHSAPLTASIVERPVDRKGRQVEDRRVMDDRATTQAGTRGSSVRARRSGLVHPTAKPAPTQTAVQDAASGRGVTSGEVTSDAQASVLRTESAMGLVSYDRELPRVDTPRDRQVVEEPVRLRVELMPGSRVPRRYPAEIRIRIQPQNLGPVRIQLRSVAGEVQGRIHVVEPQARQAIESNLPGLRAALAEQGVRVEALELSSETSSGYDRSSVEGRQHQSQTQHEQQWSLSQQRGGHNAHGRGDGNAGGGPMDARRSSDMQHGNERLHAASPSGQTALGGGRIDLLM